MKPFKINVLLFLLFAFTGQMQAQEIDARLMRNDPSRAKRNFRYNRNSYNYMLFELDKSYSVVPRKSLTKTETELIQPAVAFKTSEGNVLTREAVIPGTFNFYDFGIGLSKDGRTYIALDKETVLVFYSVPELTRLFSASPDNTK